MPVKDKRELRFIQAAEVRVTAPGEGKKPTISGYAAVFNEPTQIGDYFTEVIRPGAFTRAIKEKQDVRGLIDHDSSRILGRTKSKTLRLKEDSKGLQYEIDPPNTSIANDLMESILRGDIDQSSFAFIVRSEKWSSDDKDQVTREILDLDLIDVSPVTYPAYEATTVSVRSMFPDGEVEVPAEYRKAKMEKCSCSCASCADGDCGNCSEPDCEDAACGCLQRSKDFKERTELRLRLAERT